MLLCVPVVPALISSLVTAHFVKHIENSQPASLLNLLSAFYWPDQVHVHVCNAVEVKQGGAGKWATLLSNRLLG